MKDIFLHKIQYRFILILFIVTTSFIVFILLDNTNNKKRINELIHNLTLEKSKWFEEVLYLKSSNLESFAFDYTYWDDMVKFIYQKNLEWAKEEITPSFKKFNITYTWIFDKSYNLIFNFSLLDQDSIPFQLINNKRFREKININYFNHFFIDYNDNLIEVYGAPIQPSIDNARITKPQGYFFIGRLWDKKYISDIESFTDSRIIITNNNNISLNYQIKGDSIYLYKTLKDYDGNVLKNIIFVFSPIFLQKYNTSSKNELFNSIIFVIVLMILMIFFLNSNILKPIKLLTKSLKNNNFDLIEPLLRSKTEFKLLANLIKDFDYQRQLLIEEIKNKNMLTLDLKSSEEKYRSLFDNLTNGFALNEIIYDDNNNSIDYKIIEINPALEQMLHIEKTKVINKTASEVAKLYKSNWILKDLSIFTKVANDRIPINYEAYNERLNKYFQVTVFSSKKNYFAVILEDITERKKSEIELKEINIKLENTLNELKEANKQLYHNERLKALGQLASGIAHDINNSLAPILGYADLLLKDSKDEKILKRLKMIKTASMDIKKTIEHLREFYRPKVDDELFDFINLNNTIQGAIDLTIHRWKTIPESEGKSINIQTNFQEDLPLINGNESQLRECFVNMIINACDAMDNSGTITINTYKKSNKIYTEIIDTGKGMDEETLQHCFDPFFTTKGSQGTGLGLAMVYGIINRHDGEISISSKIGEGTKFIISFPLKYKLIEDTQQEELFFKLPSLKILLIDDDPQVLTTLESILKEQNHQVITANSSKDGIKIFSESFYSNKKFDLVFTDLGMPEMDGKEVSRIIKSIDKTTPVILVTGWGSFISNNEIETIDAILGKPVTISEINLILQKIYSE